MQDKTNRFTWSSCVMLDASAAAHLLSLSCPFSIKVWTECNEREFLIFEDCVIEEDEDGFYIPLSAEDAERLLGNVK